MVSAMAQLQGRYGRYEVRREVTGGADTIRLHAAGAVVGIGGGIFATRPVRNSFALLQVPGVSGVRGFVSNQEVGQTDQNGNLLIPELEAYYGNVLQIADEDIPLDYSVRGTRMALAPPFRGGALATFSVSPTRRISGTILIGAPTGERIPLHGRLTLTVGTDTVASPIGSGGEFYFENLPEGTFDAVVEDADGSCSLVIVVRRSDSALTNLGSLRCTTTP
jgi:outer membrane usher protein